MKDRKSVQMKLEWKDLLNLNLKERFIENNIQVPWAILSWLLAANEYYLLAIPFSILFFITAFRQAHNGIHSALGNPRFLNWWVLFLNSISMVASIHAIRFPHLKHHKHTLQESDFEGIPANMNFLEAILHGPTYYFYSHISALRFEVSKIKILMILELLATILFYALAFYFQINFIIYHFIIMLIGQMLTPLLAVWLVHRGNTTRTTRNRWISFIGADMFFHQEHHLFPNIPTIKMKELIDRLDSVHPRAYRKCIF